MTENLIFTELLTFPEALKLEVLHYVQYLKSKEMDQNVQFKPKQRKAGTLKGKIWMAPDFDAPLQDFKEYM